MAIDGSTSNLNPHVFQTVQRLERQPGQELTVDQAKVITSAIMADGQVDLQEEDLLSELLSNEMAISVDGSEADFEPMTLSFPSGKSDAALAEFDHVRRLGPSFRPDDVINPTPESWGDVSTADRQENLRELGFIARQMHANGATGPEIWGRLTEEAVNNYSGSTATPQKINDFVMQDLAIVILGPSSIHTLGMYDSIMPDRVQDPLVNEFQSDYELMGLDIENTDWLATGYAGKNYQGDEGLDITQGEAFRPEINDLTDNQVFHTFFYQYMTYTNNDPTITRMGSMKHEVFDSGQTSEDHNAAYVGMHMGLAFRELRDSEEAMSALQDWPGMTMAAYARDGGPEIANGTASPRAQATHEAVENLLDSNNIVWGMENSFIDFWSDDKPMIGQGGWIDTSNWLK